MTVKLMQRVSNITLPFSLVSPLSVFLTNVYPASIQSLHGNVEALPFSSQPVANRNNTVLKDHSSSWLGVPPHLGKKKKEYFPNCLGSSMHPSHSREMPSLLSTPGSHCQAAARAPVAYVVWCQCAELEIGVYLSRAFLRLKSFI